MVLMIKELKSGLHLGQMQVSTETQRVARSVAQPVLACLLLVRSYGRAELLTQCDRIPQALLVHGYPICTDRLRMHMRRISSGVTRFVFTMASYVAT
jgi:hypothetical protein